MSNIFNIGDKVLFDNNNKQGHPIIRKYLINLAYFQFISPPPEFDQIFVFFVYGIPLLYQLT